MSIKSNICAIIEIKDGSEFYTHIDNHKSLEKSEFDIVKYKQDVAPLFRKHVATFNDKQESKTFDNEVMSDISEMENIASDDCLRQESLATVICDCEDFTTETNKSESPVIGDEESIEATTHPHQRHTREDPIGSANNQCGEREMPLQTPEEGGEVEDRGTGYNFGKKWTYLNGNHVYMNTFWR